MSKKYVGIVFVLVVIVGVFLMLGLLQKPKSFKDILPEDFQTINVSATVTISRVEDGEPYIDFYNMEDVTVESEEYNGVLQIVEDTEYRPDLQNYISWFEKEMSSEDIEKDVFYCSIQFTNEAQEGVLIYFTNKGVWVSESGSGKKDMVYHLTDEDTYMELAEHIKENGTLFVD